MQNAVGVDGGENPAGTGPERVCRCVRLHKFIFRNLTRCRKKRFLLLRMAFCIEGMLNRFCVYEKNIQKDWWFEISSELVTLQILTGDSWILSKLCLKV